MDFLKKLNGSVIIFDGAFGTELVRRGIKTAVVPELINLTDPAAVAAIHADYVRAGADVVTTNTFGANYIKAGKDSENIENITPEKFVEVLRKAKDTNPPESRWRVTVYDADHYRDCKLYVSEGGSCVAVKPNGDIISLCKNQNDTEIYGRELLDKALNNGGDRLDAFGKNLYRFYTKNGFTPISWTPFNKEYAPDDWKEEYGEEPVVFYKYTGKSTQGNYKDFLNRVLPNHDYDEAMEQRDKEVRK